MMMKMRVIISKMDYFKHFILLFKMFILCFTFSLCLWTHQNSALNVRNSMFN